jgi:hypothetical protein
MLNSYRIRTEVGKDKSIKVQLDQDFESLEILSLKILPSEIYTRQCSDYGVIIGRVSVNGGFGIPNAKVSIFIPIDDVDQANPIISDIYPYTSLSDLNEDGYRYNLLPYIKSHSGHVPTGTFPSKNDVLTEPYLIEVFDKYYKYTAKTNDSGDYMLFGVPLGSVTIHVDIDLSDIGEFSLTPQDLIRMGAATPQQVNGRSFKASNNLNELPQIITINRTIEIEPLWGQPEVCNLGITRTDFDLSSESNIVLKPTAVFMGSMISSKDDKPQKRRCKPNARAGELCNLVTGPGEIAAIRQTINIDSSGRPILEQHQFDEGGKIIDENGTWLVDVPMNLDYIITNEFGERAISNDPKKGVPTRARYRFKIKWQQSESLSDTTKRGYFLVPNVKEWGWNNSNIDPLYNDEYNKIPCGPGNPGGDEYEMLMASYAFSLDWNDYGYGPSANQMIQEAIDGEDRFYDMKFNKVYSVSQLISEYRKGFRPNQIMSIKHILDDACDSTNNRFPTNDGIFRIDIIFILWLLFRRIIVSILFILIVIIHAVKLIACILALIVGFLKVIVCGIRDGICELTGISIAGVSPFGFLGFLCDILNSGCTAMEDAYNKLKEICQEYTLNLGNLTYPACELCECKDEGTTTANAGSSTGLNTLNDFNEENGSNTVLTPLNISAFYANCGGAGTPLGSSFGTLIAGRTVSDPPQIYDGLPVPSTASNRIYFSTSLTLPERLNLFNTKAKYFDNSPNNPGGGVNRIRVTFDTSSNSAPTTDIPNPGDKWHFDNVYIMVVPEVQLPNFTAGSIVTFVNPSLSQDVNLTGSTQNQFNTNSVTGTTIPGMTLQGVSGSEYWQSIINVPYANPDGSGTYTPANSSNYIIKQTGFTNGECYTRFASDLEYFQTIYSLSLNDFLSISVNNNLDGLKSRFLNNENKVIRIDPFTKCQQDLTLYPLPCFNQPPIDETDDLSKNYIVFLTRGVDPNSARVPCKIDLSYIFGYNTFESNSNCIINGEFKLNIPIQGSFKCINHNSPQINSDSSLLDSYSNEYLFYDSYFFKPDPTLTLPWATNLHIHYSRIDNNFAPATNNPDASYSSIYGLKVADGNDLSREWNVNYGGFNCSQTYGPNVCIPTVPGVSPNPPFYNTPATNYNRGYFKNEIVEGGSLMWMKVERYPTATNASTVIYCLASLETASAFGYDNNPSSPYVKMVDTPTYYTATYSSLGFFIPTMTMTQGPSGYQTVMRSDRLPSSSVELTGAQLPNPSTTQSYLGFANTNFSVYSISENGLQGAQLLGQSQNVATGGNLEFQETLNEVSSGEIANTFGGADSNVIETYECNPDKNYVIPLGCYYTDSNGVFTFHERPNNCYECIGQSIMENGCYKLATTVLLSLPCDYLLITEWAARTTIMFGACRNVFGHLFTNSWINGVLYMPSFVNARFFTGINDNPPNSPYSCYCKHTVVLHESNNFYYRSAPWNGSNFIGRKNAFTIGSSNEKTLNNPTTMIDLGPRDSFTQELVFSDEYDGYVIDKMNTTSYSDVSDVLNTFIYSRLANTSILSLILGGGNIDMYFNGRGLLPPKVDADYAQSIAVNSQFGVEGFDDENYESADIFNNDASASKTVFGIMYKSDTEYRDWISPKRTLLSQTSSPTTSCKVEFGINSQNVPFYQWKTNSTDGGLDTIFGNDDNEWLTTPSSFYVSRYQSIDRFNSQFQTPNDTSSAINFKGYIFNVVGGVNSFTNNVAYPSGGRHFTVGGPYYFYFGLFRGKSAYDRFLQKWIPDEII